MTTKKECSTPPSDVVMWQVSAPELGTVVHIIQAKLWIDARTEAERRFPYIPREHFTIVLHTKNG